MNPLTADMESLIDTALKEDVQSGDITTVQPCTPPAKKPRLFRVAYLSLIWFATTICALLFTAYPANASSHLTLTAPDDQNYSRDRAITPLQLPEATGGTGTLTYTLTGPGGGPGGLSFNASTRTLSGTPNRTGTTTLTYTVTDTNGDSTSVDFTVTVSDLTFVMEPENQNYTQDRAINDLQLPEGTGGTGTLTYTLTGPGGGALPESLNFNAGTRTLSGMPNTVSVTTLTYTVTDGNDASTSATFTVTVNPRLTLSHPVQLSFMQGRAINDDHPILPGAMGGTAPLVYTLTDLPPGLEFDPNTRRLSGTPGTFDRLDPPRSRLVGSPPNQTALYIVIYGVTDANGASARTSTTSEFLSIAISANLTLDGSVPDQNYTEGRPVTLQLPEATGGFGPLTYTLTAPGGLPEGLIFTPETRTLSGALVRQGLPKTLTYKVTDDNDASTSAAFTVTGKAKVALNTPTKRSYTRGTAINVDHPILPGAIAGTEPLTYTLTALGGGALPVGLEFDPNTRRLSGTPDDIPGDFVLTYMVTDANGSSDNVGFRVAINPGLMLTAPANLNYTLDTEIEGLQLPVATGGTEPLRYTLTGPSGDPLPGGLGFDANTRTLSGTPDTAGTTNLTYRVTDANDASTSVTITVMVNPGLALNARGDQNYTQGTAITNLQLPEATGGTGTLTYTLTGPSGDNLPAGLNFNADTRTLSGTPDTADTTVLTYEVTDTNGDSTSVDFRITVNVGLTLIALDDLNYTLDTEIDRLQLPEATGGTAPLVYTLTDLRPNLRFQASTRTLFGRAISIGTTTLTYTVTDANGDSTSMDFTVTVNPGLAPLTAPADQNYTEGNEIDSLPLPVATGGTAPLVYTLTDLPAGLIFTASTRTLSGTPNTAGPTTLTYEVSDANGANTSVTFMVTVNDGLTLTAPADQNYTEGTAITGLELPEATGGRAPLTYTLTSVPGLEFGADTRILSGTPSTATNTTTLTYTVTDTNNASTSVTFTVRVNASLGLDTPDDQNYTLDTEIDRLQLPEATGGRAPLTYTLTGPSGLPGGLGFDANTRTLSGTPDTAGTTNLTYRVTDANDANTSVTFMVTVNDGLTLTAPADQNYTLDTEIDRLQLPIATGGTGTLTYTLTGTLPTGLDFNANTRTLSGTPSTPATTTLTYTVTDANDATTSVDFTVTVNADLALTAPANQNYTLNTAITALQLPEATDGTGTLTYTLTGPSGGNLPAGLIFTAGTRMLSGTPSTPSTTTLTYTVTDDNGASTATFTVRINAGLTFVSAPSARIYTQNTAITPLTLPEATGGTAPLTYTLVGPRGVPEGLAFNPQTRTLSGTPSAIDDTMLTYTVTDTNGASTNATFRIFVNSNLTFVSEPADQNYTQGIAIDTQLPEATGGTGTFAYTLTGQSNVPLPAGLTFNPDTRILSGTPSMTGTTTLVYSAQDTGDSSIISVGSIFNVEVHPGLEPLTPPDDQNYTQGTKIDDLQLPPATGGTMPLTYTLTGRSNSDPSLPTGLSFDPSTRTLSGTPSTTTGTPTEFGNTELLYSVTDANGDSKSVDFRVTVNPRLALTAPDDQNYTLDTMITDLQLPAATGGTAPLTYTLTNVPGGLNFDPVTRILSGTPDDITGNFFMEYTVTDANGASTSVDFTINIGTDLTLNTPGNQNYTQGTAITVQLPEATGSTGMLTYTLTGPSTNRDLPPGLTFNPNTRILSGTPSVLGETNLVYTVTEVRDSGSPTRFGRIFLVTVNPGLAPLTAPDDQNYTQDTAISNLQLPEATGGTMPLTYTLTGPSGGNLPTGLNFNANTRTLSGTPDTPGTTTLTYEVTDTNGANTSVTFMVTVNPRLALTAPADQNYTLDTEIDRLQLPIATGGTGTLTYTLTNVPGLDFNVDTRTLSGTPDTAGTTNLTYRVTDANDATTSVDFTVTVNADLALTAPANQNYTQGTAISNLQLPEATDGTGTLTYTLTGPSGGNLPAGLIFTPGTRTLSGTPSTPGTTILTYEVTDDNGDSANATFTVIVSDGLALDTPDDQNYTEDTAITDLELPEATGGTMPLTYTLTGVPSLPPGLTFTASTRTLSGTPNTPGTTTLTYEVTDTNGDSANATFTVIVSDGLALTASGNQNYTLDTAITGLPLPEATGGTMPLTYTLTGVPSLPPGLTFTASTRILSGTPSTAGTTTLTYEVMDANGDSANATFTVIVSDGLALDTPDDQNYTEDTAITDLELPEATGGTMPLTYTLTGVPSLPPGLTFTASTRTLSGTPSTAATTVLTYEVMDANGASKSVDFTVIVSDGLALTASGNQNYTLDTAITGLPLPEATGGTMPLTYTLTGVPSLPPGLTFTASTRTLSGTPNTAGTTTLTYRVTDTNGDSANATFTVIVSDGLALDTPDDQNYTEDTAITALQLPVATGGTAPRTYALTGPGGGNLPAGLNFNANTRMLSGTPSTAATTVLTYEVMDANGATTSVDFTVIVNTGLALTASGNQNYTQGTEIDDLELPAATGGTGTLVYTLTNVPGLDFNPGTRILSGTPSTPDTTTLTYEVTDTNGASTSVDFTVTVNAGLALTAPANQNYTEGRVITALELPVATGGTGTLVYTLTNVPGLDFNPGTRILSGTPSTADTFDLTYEVTDDNGATTSVDFTVIVNTGLALTASGNQNYTQGTEIDDLELPAATGGTGTLVYTLTNVPGLDFNPGTRILSGTPSTADTFDLTYEVTDDNGATTSVDFTVIVNTGLALTASGNQNYTRGTAITALQLPVATGGTGTLVYTLTSVPGLTFTASTRTLSGTPDTADTTTLTYRVTDDNGATTSVDFTVIVNTGLALTASGNQNYTQGTEIDDLLLPVATGGTGTLVYTLTNVPGLDFNPGTRTLSGTPSTPDTTTLTYRVTDDNGATTSVDFTVIVNTGLALTASGNQNYTQGTEIDDLELPVATGGTGTLVYTLTNVPGLDFNPGTRTLSGTPSTPDTTTLTYRVTDDNGATTSVDFTVIVNTGLALTASGNQNYTQGTEIDDLELPAATGGTGTLVYTLTNVPGLDFNPGTRTLSGTPSTPDTTTLTYRVTDDNGATTSVDFTVTVSDGLTFDSEPANQNYTQGTAINNLELPAATGGTGTLTYTLTSVPGLTFTPGTRILSGTPDTADTTTLTYEVMDANGASDSVDFTVTVNAGLALTASGNQNYTQGTAINNLELPAATGGTGTLTYTLTSVPGLTFTPGTRILSGTPSTADTFDLTYEVMDANGASDSVDFTVTVNAGLALTASGNQNYTQGTEIDDLELPVATGGTGTLVYTLTGPSGGNLPAGLTFDTRTLSGTPSTADTTTLTYRVTDDNGATTSVDFTVTVSDGLTFDSEPANQNYTQGTAINNLELPAATGGTGTLTYTLTSVPGLTFTPGTRILSGTPDTADTTTLTYEVMDANGASDSVDFTVTVNAGLALTASGNQNYTQGTAINNLELPAATGGTGTLTYTLTSVPGLTFTPGTRILSGTPDTADTTTLTYEVMDANGASDSVDFTVTVNAGLALTASGNQNYTQGTAINNLELPAATGGTGTLTYTLTSVPGLTFTPGTRILSGTPSTADTTTLTYEVMDANGASDSVDFTVTVNAGLALTASGNQNYTQGTAINNLELPAATGGTGTLTYTLTSVPGLTFTPGTRTLSGTPSTPDTTTLTYRVTDDNGATTSVDFTVIVNTGLALTASGNQNYTQGTEIDDLELPVATGGTGTLVYTLTGPSGGNLPAGLTFDTRTLSGTPSTPDTTTLTYRVTDDNGATTSVDFTVTVSDGLTFDSEPANQNYTQGTAINNLELPAATGGTGTLTYTLTSVPGLTFTPGTRILSGTPDTADTTTLTYEVMDANGASDSVDFTVTVNAGLALTASGNQNYTQGTAINNLELPEASGGTAPRTYTLTGPSGDNLPAGLTFSGRTLSGTPTEVGTTTLTYEVTDANNASTSVDFTVIVSDGLALTAPANQNYTLDTAITNLELPEASGGTAPRTYTLTGPSGDNLPAGLTFSGRTLSGTPTEVGTTTLTYEVTDANNASTSVDFTVIVSDGLALTAPANQNYTLDTAITDLQLPVATGGTAPLVYTLTGPSGDNLPAGLTFSGRTLSGTPTEVGTTTLTYEVTDANNASTSVDFTVIVSDGLALTAPANQNYTLDTAITNLELPEASGGTAPRTYTLTGPSGDNLPAGLTFSGRTLSGTPTEVGTTTLTYEVTDANNASTSVDFTVIVSDGLALTAPANQNYTLDTAITDLQLPVATGGTAPLVYTLTGPGGGNLPAGLNFNANTRTLSGTPDTPGTTTLTYEVTDTNGDSANATFTVIVSDGLALTASGNQNYTQDTAITDLQLPEASGGTAPRTYTLTGPGGDNLPAGLTFSGRTLSGTPTEVGTTTLTYEVTDANNASTSVDFTVIVSDGLALTAPANQNYTLDTAITNLELPVATGGTAPLVYTLTGPGGGNLPAGLNFNAGTRTLSGTPDTPGTTTLTYEVTDTNGDSANATFTVIVSDGLALTASGNQNYTQDTAITDLQLPVATGGTAPLVYTLTGPGGGNLPAGLNFNANTRTLSGTPDTPGTTTLTYEVTDTNGDSANATFTVIVSDGLALTASGNQNYTQDTAITDLQLPVATGGTAPLVYTLTGPGGGNLPAGLNFNAGTRTLSGTPDTPGTTTLTYEVTDTNGDSANATFTVIVSDGLALTASGNQNYTQDTAITDLQLPVATGGTAPLVYTLTGPGGGNLPAGLNFNAGTRTLSGTPDTPGTTTLTYEVTDTNGDSANATFTVIVSDGLALTASGNQNYTQDTAITDLQLPVATGGTAPLVYTLTGPGGGNLPAGLNFNANTRTLSGTPDTPGTTTLTYEVTDTNGDSANATFTVIVSDGLALTASGNQNYTQDTAITDLQLPVATGGTAPLVYTLTGPGGGNLPAGLNFNAGTRTLSGTPDTPGTTTLTYEVTDTNGDSANATFTVIVSDGLALTASGNQNYTQDTAITDLQLPVATGGTAPLVYTLTGPGGGNLPAGLNFNAGTRTLSGTPDTPGTTTLTYEVTDTNGDSANATFTVIVSDGLALTASGNQNYTQDTAITDLQLPVATGGTAPLVYTLTGPGGGNLPAGLNFNAGTRTLSGTPDTPGTTTLTYEVTDTNGDSANATFTVIVSDGLALTASGNQNYTQDTAITDLQLPVATGGTAPLVYTLTGPGGGNLPAGLNFNAGTRTLSGTPDTPGTTTLTYEVTDTNGDSANATFTVIVSDGLALTASGNQNYTQDTAITDLQLPVATGGTAPLVYTLTGPGGGNLPAGLNFNAGTRTLSGTPDTPGTTTLTYEVTDTNGDSANATFTVIVSDGLALTASGNQNYTQDTAITDLQLPVATGGTAPLVYTLTGPGGGNLPAGLNFNANTRTLSGTPDTPGTTTLTYEVTDTNGDSENATFTVIVSDGLALTASGNQNYTQDTAITALQLPVATGGTAPLVYTLTGPGGGNLPAGLNFNAGTRTLSGTPDTPGTTTLTYEVTDTNGDSANATFTVIVSDGLALTASGNQNYTEDTAITDLQLPVATGGTAPLVYTLTGPGGGNLPAGLNFNAGTRTLSGTPDTPGTTTLTYEVTDTNGDSANATFTVIVSDGLALTASGNQNYTEDTAITALQLPVATGGTAPLVYTLTGTLPTGLSFTAGTRTLSGTPDTPGTTTLTYEVTDTNGDSANATFTVIVSDGLALTASGNQNYTQDTAITALQLPVATGGTAPLVYTLTGPGGGNLPAGLNFNAGTRTLSGTPDTPGTTTLTYEVTDTNGDSANATFTVIVSDGLALTASGNQNYTEDTAITDLQLPVATGGTAPLVYTLTGPGGGNLPAGLNFNAGTRTLSGTPDTPGTTTLTYEVTDTNGDSANATFTVIVSDGLALTASGNQNYTEDTAITALQLPVATGGTAPLVYTLTGTLPTGLSFTAGTRTLSGTPDTPGTTTLTYEVTDTNGDSANATFTITVNAGLALTASGNQNYTRGTAISNLILPAATGGTGTLVYTLTSVPGLTFTASTRTLSGTPSTAGTTTLTYTVTDTNGASTSVDFTVSVSDGLALTASGNQNYTQGTAITALQLPAATGGTGTLTYTLTSVPGLTFTASTRTLSGTPSTAGTTTLTYTVSDTNGASTTATFTVMVNAGLALTASGNQNYTQGTAITALQLPAATGGTGTLTYTLTGPSGGNLPTGLSFTANTRTLSGTPSTAGTTTLTYMVTDTNGASTTATFTVMVNAGLALTASGNQNYTRGTAISNLILPAATGGTGTLTYTLTSVPGLTFTASTRTLSGTPSTAGTTTLTYTVTDTNGASTNATFTVMVNAGLALTASGNQNYTRGTAISNLILPAATGGTGTLTYTLTSVPGLTFTASTRTLSGTPSTADTTTLTYTVTDTNGASTSVTFTVMVSAGLTLDTPGNQNYTLDTAIPDLQLPAATGGTGTLVYTLTGPGGLPGGLTFTAGTRTLSGTPDTAGTTTLTYSVTSANGASTNATFTVRVSDNTDEGFADLNTLILPEMARTIADQKVSAITQRIAKTMSGGSTRSVTIAGHSTLAEAASAHGQAIADGTLSLKDLLNNSDFVLPLNDAGGTDSGALWGGGSYRSFEGSGGEDVDFDGDLFSAYLGLDTKPRDDLLIGLTLSWSQGNLDYQRSELERKGDYKLDLTSVNPYVGWEVLAGKLDLWATASYGWGDLKINDDGSDQASSYVETWDVAVGGNIQLSQATSPVLFRLKSSALLTEMDVEGSDDIAGLDVDVSLLRMVLEGTDKHLLADGAYVEPSLEVGVRYNGGDGETGFEAELGAGFRYINPIAGLTLEGRARTLVGRDNYNAWGVSGLMLLEQGSNGRGLSFSLSPGYGNTNSGTEKIWKDGLRDEISGDQDYSLRLDTRIGYGLTAPGVRGLLTPYSEMTFGGSDRSYRLGIRWELDSLFDLNLTGERIESNSSTADRAIDRAMLKGNIRF